MGKTSGRPQDGQHPSRFLPPLPQSHTYSKHRSGGGGGGGAPGVGRRPLEVRCRLSALLAELMPGDLDGFLFPSGGAEANEAAIRIARRYTGRHKILTQYRSYHGATSSALAATGDFRRHFDEGGAAGFVKARQPRLLRRITAAGFVM